MKKIKVMAISILNKIEYLVLLVAAFAAQSKISEAIRKAFTSFIRKTDNKYICTQKTSIYV